MPGGRFARPVALIFLLALLALPLVAFADADAEPEVSAPYRRPFDGDQPSLRGGLVLAWLLLCGSALLRLDRTQRLAATFFPGSSGGRGAA